jgi:hypothetical protein
VPYTAAGFAVSFIHHIHSAERAERAAYAHAAKQQFKRWMGYQIKPDNAVTTPWQRGEYAIGVRLA